FPQLDPGLTVLVDSGKPCTEKKAVKRRGVPMVKVGGAEGYRQVKVLEFFDCPGPRQGVEDLRELLHKGAQGDRAAEVFQSGLSKVFKAEDTTMSTYLVNRSSSVIGFKTPIDMLRNMGFNKSWEYKKTFIGSGVGTSSVHVSQGVKFEVEPQEDHAFEVGPLRNDCQGDGSHNVQTQDLIYYHSVCDRGQHLAWELFSYRKDNNEVVFAVAAVDKIYAHESLTFNNTVACEVISMWNTRLKDDIDARSMCMCLATVARNAVTAALSIIRSIHQVEIWDTNGLLDKAKGNVLGMKIVRDQSDAVKEAIWLKGLVIESGFELMIVAGIATNALSKVIPGLRFQHRLKLLRIEDF
ncbi:hypothetical protein Tco_0784197, partial [Tanacetum coccineum]